MPDRAVVVLAGVAWVGAWSAVPTPWWAAAAIAMVAYGSRRPWLLCLGVFLLAGGLATSARAGLGGLQAGPIDAEVTLLTDPERFGDEVRVEVRADGRHLEAWADGSRGADVVDRDAGDRVRVRGRVEPFASPDGRQRSRHLAGRLEMSAVGSWHPGGPIDRLANGYRGLLAQGAVSLDADQRSLLAGLVLGDDRAQTPTLVDAFRGAGLTHLLAVSGQNVAFVLLVVGPLLRRLPLGGRVVSVLAVLAVFGVVTRFEPSVLRATAMAGVAVVSSAMGRPAGGRRALALAVTALVLVDPLLVHSIGFTLSVAASFGIIVWSRPIAASLTARTPGRPSRRGDRRRPTGRGSRARRHLRLLADRIAAGQSAGRAGGRTGDGLGDDGRRGRRARAGAAGRGHPLADTGPAGLDRVRRPRWCCGSARRPGGAVAGGGRRRVVVVVGRPSPAALASDRAGGRRVRSARAGCRGRGGAGAGPLAPHGRSALAIGERLGAGRPRRAPSGPAPGRASPSAGPRARPDRCRGATG